MSHLSQRSSLSPRGITGAIIVGFALITSLLAASAAAEQDGTTRLRVVSYNVACGRWATPERIAEELKPLNPDIVMLNEVPKANPGEKVKDWSRRLAEALGLPHVHVGKVSSAGHKAPKWGDMTGNYGGKFKSILSRTPLTAGEEFQPEGSGWKRATAVRVETEIGGRTFALYSLHFPGFAHHKNQPSKVEAWLGAKHKQLADRIKAEDPSVDIIVGGDFNEWTDGLVMRSLLEDAKLENAITARSIDHILFSTTRPIKVVEAKRDWGPENQNEQNVRSKGCLSDHPWVYCELEIPAASGAEAPQKVIRCGPLLAAETAAAKPNILFIMVDDLGKEWVSCYGAEDIKTPNIDALAAGGMTFHNAYSMGSCTPSRTTLLTGKYPSRNGWGSHWDVPRWGVGYFDWKKKENTTFARLMKDLGYATCAAGKWQINDFRLEPHALKKHGFDDWAMWTGFETGNPPSSERYQDAYINTPDGGSKTYAGKFGPDVYTDRLIQFMRKHKDEPMCLYYPMPLLHSPFVTTPDMPDAKSRTDLFKAMLLYVDKMVGQLVREVDQLGIRERTIIIFTSDNGTDAKITGTRHGRKVKGGKGSQREAGVNAPFIVNGPGLVPAGVETDALTDLSNMLPTFVELGRGQIPEDLVLDGTSIAPLIRGKENDSKREWSMALSFGAARLDGTGVRGRKDFAPRVLRDKRYKVWVSDAKKIDRLHDLQEDPLEETNLLDSEKREHKQALAKFKQVVDSFPDKDARPSYAPRAANAWDRTK